MLIFVVLAVFIAGLMVGRTPEYLGKKIEAYDVKMAMLYVLIFPLIILTLDGRSSCCCPTSGSQRLNNPGPHGFSEILYAFTSGAGNNGSAFAGLGANWWYNIAMGWDMLIGRFLMMIPVLALAGNLAQKKSVPPSPGTFPVNTPLFTVLLVGVVLILGALTFFPALSLGPILEHLLLQAGQALLTDIDTGIRTRQRRTVMAEKTSLWNTQIMGQATLDSAFASSIRAGWSRTR